MTFSTLTQSGSGDSIRVYNDSICALIGGLSPAGAAQTEVVTRDSVANIVVASTVAATLAALTAPAPATVLFTQADGVLTCRIAPTGVDEIIPSGAANSKVVLLDGTVVYVVGTPTAVAAALAAGTPVVQQPSRIVLQAVITGDGTIAGQLSDYDITLGFDPAYVALSADYTLEMTGADVPTSYQVFVSQLLATEGCIYNSAPTGVGAPTFTVTSRAAARARGGGQMNSAGVLQAGNYGIASVVKGGGSGEYTVTADNTTRRSQLLATIAEPLAFFATVTTTSDGVFVLRTFDATGAAADATCNLAILALDEDGVSPPIESMFSLMVVSLDA